jgi:membrane-associated phospholipid phosphatase
LISAWLLASALAATSAQDAPLRNEPLPAPVLAGYQRSVYRVRLGVDIPAIVIPGALALVRLFGTSTLARRSCPCDPATLSPLDRGAVGNHSAAAGTASDITLASAIIAPAIFEFVDLGLHWPLFEDLMVLTEAIMVDTGIQAMTALLVSRPRPRTYAGDPAFVTSGEGYVSFYAGHVATVVVSLTGLAMTMRLRYGERFWPWLVTLVVGTSVAIERVEYGYHFPTDVIAGALAGLAIGVTVPLLHARKSTVALRVVPAPGGVALAGGF